MSFDGAQDVPSGACFLLKHWQNLWNKIYTYEVFHQCEHSCALEGVVLLQNLYNKYHICISFDHQEYVLIEYVGSYSNLFQ